MAERVEIKCDSVFMHQRWNCKPFVGDLPTLFWVSLPNMPYYETNTPHHMVTLHEDVKAVVLYEEDTFPEDIRRLYPVTDEDVDVAIECSQDAHAPEYVSFFRNNPDVAILYNDLEYIIFTSRCKLSLSEFQGK